MAAEGWTERKLPKKHIILVAGLGEKKSADAVKQAIHQLQDLPKSESYSFAAILDANPGNHPSVEYPPKVAPTRQNNPAAIYLWRFIGTYGPDLVIDLRLGGDTPRIRMGKRSGGIDKALAKATKAETNSLLMEHLLLHYGVKIQRSRLYTCHTT